MHEYFDTRGFGVEAVDDLAAAQHMVRQEAPDLILVDELLLDDPMRAWLDAISLSTRPPRLVLARLDADRDEHDDDAPWHLVLHKPLTPRDLFNHTLRLLESVPAPQQSDDAPTRRLTEPPTSSSTHRARPLPGSTVHTPAAPHLATPALRMGVGQAPDRDDPAPRARDLISVGPSPSSSTATTANRLSTVRHVYGRRLPGLLASLRRGIDAARTGDVLALDESRRVAQQLRGTSGSFGFEATSRAIADIELHLASVAPNTPEDHTWALIDRAFDAARLATERDAADTTRPPIAARALPELALAHLRRAAAALGLEVATDEPDDAPRAALVITRPDALDAQRPGPVLHLGPPTPILTANGAPVLHLTPDASPEALLEALLTLQALGPPARALVLTPDPATPHVRPPLAFFAEASRRFNAPRLALASLRLRNTDRLTEHFGPHAIDDAERHLARLLETRLRADDLRGHWVRGRLALLLSADAADRAELICDRLVQAATALPVSLGSSHGQLEVTATVARPPEHGHDLVALLAHAMA